MKTGSSTDLPIGTQALILSKLYYGALSKSLGNLEIERYYSVLFFLHHHQNVCQQVVCDHLKIDKTAMVKVLDYLSKAGYIERKTNPNDRREHFICLSKKGEKQTEKIVKSFNSIDEKAFEAISESDRKTFIKVMNVVSQNLNGLPSNDLFFNYKKTKAKK